jgi:hypothetical protein
MLNPVAEPSTAVPTCLHPGCNVQGDLNLSECGLCGERMCPAHDCDYPVPE